MRVLFPLYLSLLLSVGCHAVGSKPRLVHSQPSAEALAERVLEALAKQDEAGLKTLRITKEEFCTYVWPELPSSQIPNVTCDWAWGNQDPKSYFGLRQILARYGGQEYELVRIRFAKGTTEYKSFKVHGDAYVTVKDRSGRETELKLCGSMLEYAGQFKLFSYVLD